MQKEKYPRKWFKSTDNKLLGFCRKVREITWKSDPSRKWEEYKVFLTYKGTKYVLNARDESKYEQWNDFGIDFVGYPSQFESFLVLSEWKSLKRMIDGESIEARFEIKNEETDETLHEWKGKLVQFEPSSSSKNTEKKNKKRKFDEIKSFSTS